MIMVKHGKSLALSIIINNYSLIIITGTGRKANSRSMTIVVLFYGVSCPFGHDTVEICDVQIVIVGHFFGDKGRDDDPLEFIYTVVLMIFIMLILASRKDHVHGWK